MAGDERRALIGLWCVAGVGPRSIDLIRSTCGSLADITDLPTLDWLSSVLLPEPAKVALSPLQSLGAHADAVLERAAAGEIKLCFAGEDAYPRGLAGINSAPPFLFYKGRGDRPNAARRLGMVGSRIFEPNFIDTAFSLARQLATRLIIVSGAAEGIDQLCHRGALEAHGETWAFMAGGLDSLDLPQVKLADQMLPLGGTIFSEFPPGVRCLKKHFPRRNRLISGSSDAVMILRGGPQSGTIHTVKYAVDQGRRLLALPGQINHPTAHVPNQLIRSGAARLIQGAAEVFAEMGLDATTSPEAEPEAPAVDMMTLSANAHRAFDALDRAPADFDQVLLRASPLNSGQLASALIELELAGLLVQRPGRLYERR